MPSVPVLVAFAVAGAALAWRGGDMLVQASDRLGAYYGLPPIVQGAIIAAVGSSFPELSSIVIATLRYQSFDIGVGAVVGSAVYNILIIPAVSALVGEGQRLASNRDLVYKEAQFYLLSIAVLVLTFSLAVIYSPATDTAGLNGFVTRSLALIPLGLYGLYIFIQQQDTADYDADPSNADGIDATRQWGLLVAGLLVILVAVERLVHSVDLIGTSLGVPGFIMGVTIAAGATSLPDGLVSVRAARNGRGVASLANVLGSNTFDLLVAIPVGVLIAGSTTINFAMAIPMFGVLTLSTILLFTVLRTGLALSDAESYALLVSYLVFVGWVVLETVSDAVNLLPN